jgi:MoxR-like ATPase
MAGISRGNSKVSLSWNAALSGVMFLSTLWQAQASQPLTQPGVEKCEVLFPYRKSKDSFSMSPFPSVKVHTRALKKSVSQESLAQSWNESRAGLLRFQEKYADKQRLLLDMASSLVSRTHLHLDGGPQSGKTSISHDFAKVVLQSYLKNQAAPEKALWIHQFNKMNSESTVLGPYITDAFEKGQMKRLREGSLSDDQKLIAIFDQIGQANSFVLMPLFQVLANRSIFDGTENISLGLMSAIGISNESFAQMLARSGVYRPTMEALADRFQAHAFTPHRHTSTEDAIQFRKKVKAFQESGKELLPMDLITLQQNLVQKFASHPRPSMAWST